MASINQVFTPRNQDVNLAMYVPRVDHETRLLRSIRGSMHSLLFGESGNGKSWLYKKVLGQEKIRYRVANCSNASRLKSITSEICTALLPEGASQKIGYTENKEASIKAIVAEGKLVHQSQYKVQQPDPLMAAFETFRRELGSAPGVLVLDNLESIFGQPSLMDELADIIILLDDERYARYGIKLLIVGVPNGVLEYFAKTKNLESVSNRIEELDKVGSLTAPMVQTLCQRGFNEQLKFGISIPVMQSIAKHVHHVTMGVAQRVHEYCEKLAHIISENRSYTPDLLDTADHEWMKVGLRQAYTVVESHLNAKRTTISRRNQVIYCLGQVKTHQIDSSRIIQMIRECFPNSVAKGNMGVSTILSELAGGETPLLAKNPKTNDYRIRDPRYIMCIRTILYISKETSSVEKRSFVI